MLNFRNTNIVFLILLAILVAVHVQIGMHWLYYALLFLTYSGIVFWGCIQISSGFFIPVVCKVETDRKEIAISFDDGPAVNYTPAILEILKKEQVPATFFIIGSRIEDNEGILKQIYNDGHIIGNHSFSHHFLFDLFSAKKMCLDLKQLDEELFRVTGLKPKLFRPPYGVTNPNLKKAIIRGGYTPVGWSVRSLDTVATDEPTLLDKINEAIRPGEVFLFHDTCRITVNILPEFIKEVKKRGFDIVPLDKLLALKAYE